jgi:hypothetical protein
MHKNTASLLRKMGVFGLFPARVLSSDDRGESRRRLELLRNAYPGETAVVLSCGPSLETVWSPEFEEAIRGKLIITVKQAHDLARKVSDIHIYNEIRMKRYEYPEATVRIGVSKFATTYPPHLHLPIRSYRWEKALFVTNEYERWDLENGVERPWGIGIMFELGLFLPSYLGCSKLLIVGFDMNRRGKYHYYDQNDTLDAESYRVDNKEFGYARQSVKYYRKWAAGKGLDVRLFSPLSVLELPRLHSLGEAICFLQEGVS